jgi:hypothetical protein
MMPARLDFLADLCVLDDGIANIEGQLVCNGGKADQWFGPL